MKPIALALVAMLAVTSQALANEIVTTTDGRLVILYSDGTYEELDETADNDSCLSLSNAASRVVSRTDLGVVMSWRVDLSNDCAAPKNLFLDITYLDADGFSLIERSELISIQGGETRTLSSQVRTTDHDLVDQIDTMSIWPRTLNY